VRGRKESFEYFHHFALFNLKKYLNSLENSKAAKILNIKILIKIITNLINNV